MMQLPHKLSDLAQIAVDDVKRMEAAPGYAVAMESWHTQIGSFGCEVCAAGAIMVCRLGLDDPKLDMWRVTEFPERFGEHNYRALLAVDCLRRGHVGAALEVLIDPKQWMNLPLDDYSDTHDLARQIHDYDDIPQEWHADMKGLIADLREAGL